MKLVLILSIITLFLLPVVVNAVDSTTVGSISLASTFRSIGVVSSYTGDDNNNSLATLEYKEKNASTWKQAHPMSLVGGDRIRKQWAVSIVMLNPDTDYDVRVTYTDSDGVSGTNPVTASIRTRGENWPTGTGTTYYVSTTGSDTNSGTITSPFRTIQKAASVVSPGSTVFIRGGTYRETVTLTRGGTASAYILFQNYPGETVNIDGSDEAIANGSVTWTSYGGGIYYTDLSWSAIVGDNMGYAAVDGQRMYFYKSKFNTFDNFQTDSWVVNRSSWYWNSSINRLYVKLVNIGNPDPATHQMTVARRSLGFYFNGYGSNNPDYTVLKGINVLSHQQFGIQSYQAGNLLIDTCTVSGYGNVGIYSGSGNNITVQNCQVVDGDMRQVPWDALKRTEQETGGIVVKESQGAVIRNNIVEGGMDAIALGGGSSGTWQDDTDVYDNSISKVSDDGMSLDVYNGKNVRAWGNTILGGLSPISAAPVQAGPVYIFRNTVFRTTGAALKLGYNNPSVGPHFLYHNTIYLPDANGGIGVSSYGGDYLRSAVLRNNIVFIGYTASNAYAVYNNFKCTPSPCTGASFLEQWDMNYDDLFTKGSILVRWRRTDTSYATLAAFQAGTGEELNGISADPLFVDQTNGDLRLQSSSPAIDKGVVIPNFNNLDSAWPYRGTAPDMGAFEFDSGAPPADITPPSASISINSGASTTSSTSITLTLTCSDISGINAVRYSNDGVFDTEIWESFNSTKSWNLTSGDGTKTVWYQCRDNSANQNNATVSDTIVLDSTAPVDTTPPVRSNGQPSGITLPAGTTQTNINLTATDSTPPVSCRYSNTAGTAYSSMTNTLSNIGGNTYSATVSSLTNGNTYNYYVRCIDAVGNPNTNDFAITFSVASTGALSIRVSAAADDTFRTGATGFSTTSIAFDVGNPSQNSSARFININIPQGAIITNAYLSVVARGAGSGSNVLTKVYAENVDSATQITSYNDFDGRVLTTGTSWTITALWTTGTMYNSTNISSEIQTVVNRAGWRSGNAINIFWKDDASVAGAYRNSYSYDGSASNAPLLFISYTTPVVDTDPPTRSNGQPNGILATGTNQAIMNLTTDEAATCRYSNTSGVAYGSMTDAFSTTGSTFHSRLMTGLANGSSYRYYIRCNDTAGNANLDDYNISFSVGLSGENCIDADNDNYYSTVNCTAGNDCNDNNNAINPSAAEVCGNGIDENCDGVDASCPQPPIQPPGGVVPVNPPVETPITKEPEVKEAIKVEENIGAISLELITPDKVESGEMFNVTVWLLSPVTSAYILTVADMQQQVELEAGKEMLVTVPVRAPEAKGVFTLTAAIDGTSRAKDIVLDYLPLFLYVDESRTGNETFVNITVKNYESMSTELRIIRDGRSDAFFELIEGKKEYNRQLKLTQAGEYKIIASASSEGKIIDTDEYLLTVGGEKKFDYRLILIIVFAFVVMVITLIVMIR